MSKFSRLFEPIMIGGLEIKNRIVFPPISCELANPDGTISAEMMEFYGERARGGVGLVIVETTYIDRRGKRLPRNPLVDDDVFIPGLRELAKSIKRGGAKSCVQLCHGGISCVRSVTGSPPVGPSRVSYEITHASEKEGETAEELTLEQIHQLIEAFIAGAARAREAGFDAVEIHGAHGYLVSNFFSPDVNHRTDSYGGDIRNRARFCEEIVRGIKERVDRRFPVITRLNCRDYMRRGLEFPDAIAASQILEKAGADAIHLSGGVHSSIPFMIGAHMSIPAGVFVKYAAELKKQIRVPVIAVNRIHDPDLAEEVLERGDADMVAMGRALLADPHLPAKAKKGDLEDIVPCLSCNECFASLYAGRIACTVNPMAGRELSLKGRMAKRKLPKRVAIIGGGVGGMACAIAAARIGHRVTVFEGQPFLGGALRMAMLGPNREPLKRLLAYFERQVRGSGAEVRLSRPLTLPEAEALKADVYVVATGAKPFIPSIPGGERKIVVPGMEALQHPGKAGRRCIIYGGGLLAVELADLLMTEDPRRQITMVVRSEILKKANFSDKTYYLGRLREHGIRVLEKTLIVEIRAGSVVLEPADKWRLEILDVDTVMTATGWTSLDSLANELTVAGFRTVTVGDALTPRKLLNAIHEGTSAGCDI